MIQPESERNNVRHSRSGRIEADKIITQDLTQTDVEGRPSGDFRGRMRDIRYSKAQVTQGVGTELITGAARALARLVRAAS